VSEGAVSATDETALDTVRLTLTACLAGLRSALGYANAAADAWSTGDDPFEPLDAAAGALNRARAQTDALRVVLPSHSRRVRLADRAVERVAEALAVVRGLPPMALDLDADASQEAAEAEEDVLEALERAFGAAERAMQAASA
jgi:hypothetical protein